MSVSAASPSPTSSWPARDVPMPSRNVFTSPPFPGLCSSRDLDALQMLGGASAVLRLVGVDAATGLSEASVVDHRARFGANTYPSVPARSFLSFVWDALHDVTLIILIVAAGLSLVAEMISDVANGWHDGVAILFAVFLCVFVSAYNDYSQMLQFRALNAEKSDIQVNVLRSGRRQAVSVFDLVVGDIAVVALGDQIPADGLLLSGQAVSVDESAMTGESDMLPKNPESKPFMLSGCKMNEGYGEMVVTAVGMQTECVRRAFPASPPAAHAAAPGGAASWRSPRR